MMRVSHLIRQFHRWMSIIFTLLVIVVFVISSRPAPPEWAFYTPLPALALMLLSGLYLFALPYFRKRGV
jgi:ABC-type polysaccharide/polyol phosphate export permease